MPATLTPTALFEFAADCRERGSLPTIRQCATEFGVRQEEIRDLIDGLGDCPAGGAYFGINVAFAVSGSVALLNLGDQTVEAIRED